MKIRQKTDPKTLAFLFTSPSSLSLSLFTFLLSIFFYLSTSLPPILSIYLFFHFCLFLPLSLSLIIPSLFRLLNPFLLTLYRISSPEALTAATDSSRRDSRTIAVVDSAPLRWSGERLVYVF